MNISKYIDSLIASGRYTFTTSEAEQALGVSKVATRSALRRLRQKNVVAVSTRGFQLIVPPEYRILGCMPANYFIDDLMKFLKTPYYVGLLSAAEFHGASHHKPQQFQVITNKARAEINCGKIRIVFVAKKGVEFTATQTLNTPYGFVTISTPEATAIDLVTYPHHSAGIDNIATILVELSEKIESKRMLALMENSKELAWIQRLGYLFEIIGENKLAEIFKKHLSTQRVQPCALQRGLSIKGVPYNEKWGVFINVEVELDV